MSKLFQALFSGLFFTFILDFFLFLGVKLHYLDRLNIDIYYNVLFADSQNIYIFALATILLGYTTLYLSNKVAILTLGSLFLLTFATLLPPLGYRAGTIICMQKGVTLRTDKFSYYGDIYYKAREKVFFYDYKLEKMIIIDKYKLKEKI